MSANTAVWVLTIMVGLALVGGAFLVFTQGSLIGEQPATPAQQSQAGTLKNLGDPATINVRAYDREANAGGQVASSLYAVCEYGGTKSLAADAKTTSATASTSFSTVVGAKCKAVAFDGTYYGDELEFDVDRAVLDKNLDVHAHTGVRPMRTEWYYQGAKIGSSTGSTNITLGSGQADAFDYVKITNNLTNSAWDFKGIVFDTVDSTNLTDMGIGKLTSGSVPKRLASTANYAWYLPSAVRLKAWDTYSTGTVPLEAKDSSSNPAETITVYFLDEAKFKSVVGSTANTILTGVEGDSLGTPSDVGAQDTNQTLTIL